MNTASNYLCKILAAALLLLPLVAGQSLARELSNAAFEKPDLSQSAGSSPAMFSSGLLGDDDISMPETKSVSKAVLYSLLLPGLGQRYLGETTPARVFFLLDVAIWTSFVVFTVQADLREDSYQEYARTFAGVTRLNHSDDYYGVLFRFKAEGSAILGLLWNRENGQWRIVAYRAFEQ